MALTVLNIPMGSLSVWVYLSLYNSSFPQSCSRPSISPSQARQVNPVQRERLEKKLFHSSNGTSMRWRSWFRMIFFCKQCDLACEESTPLHMPEFTMGCDARNMARMTLKHEFLIMVKSEKNDSSWHTIPSQYARPPIRSIDWDKLMKPVLSRSK